MALKHFTVQDGNKYENTKEVEVECHCCHKKSIVYLVINGFYYCDEHGPHFYFMRGRRYLREYFATEKWKTRPRWICEFCKDFIVDFIVGGKKRITNSKRVQCGLIKYIDK